MKQRWPILFKESEEEALEYGMDELLLVDEKILSDKFTLLNELMGILKDEWENDMLVGEAGDILKRLGVVA